MKISSKILHPSVILTLALVASSCTTVNKLSTKTRQLFGGDLQVEVTVSPNLNQKSPLAVELLLFEDKKLIPAVEGLEAREWFQSREQYFLDNKKGVRSYLWEWVPGQSVEPLTVKIKAGTKQAILFANYMAPGAHREKLDPRRHFVLHLGERKFRVEVDE